MSTIFSLTLAPFEAVLRLAYSRPWMSILLSAVAAVIAYLLHREMWLAFFACFGAYILMWLDEKEHPHALELGTSDNVE